MREPADDTPRDPELIRQKLNHDTARIRWSELQEAQQQELVVAVSTELDLIEVGCRFTLDDRAQVEAWLEQGLLQKVGASQAEGWQSSDAQLWAVVVAPWVLVQEPKPGSR